MTTELVHADQGSDNLVMQNARIIFRNFAGKEGQYNAEGDRNFCVLLDPETAQRMAADGWNIKHLKAREPDDEPQPYLQVSVKYRGRNGQSVRPPLIMMITSKGRVDLGEDECELLDWVDIANVDLIVRPYQWAVSGKSGIKAYLKSLAITIQEDYLQQKYADVQYAVEAPSVKPLAIEAGDGLGDMDVVDGEILED